ncbi:MAG TPA: flagellar hook-associated protein FlgK [Blastocatellia bacterium]|nr:flagellar hook-associated protein FlgK [Blastocatellia bacterium]
MGVNFSAFEIGRRALRSSQLGVTVTGQNIANVNTPGYTRQRLETINEISNLRPTGTGATIDGVRAQRDQFIEARLQTETVISGRLQARRDALAPVDTVFNDAGTGGGIESATAEFFGAFRSLEAQPASAPLRAVVTQKADALTSAFRVTRSRVAEIQKDADGALRDTVEQANALSQRVADLNTQISVAERTGGDALQLRDQRGEVVRQLGSLVGARAIETDGQTTLTLGDGRALVIGERAFTLEATDTPPNGFAQLSLEGQPLANVDGKLRGLLDAIGDIDGQITGLDQLAASITDRVNTLHAAGSDLNGNDGGEFFTTPASGSVTAANFTVSAAVKANPRLIVASARNAGSGDASVARGIANLLEDQNSVAGSRTGSFESIYASLVSDAGAGVKSAEDALTTQQAILAQTTAQRDSVSGVSLDEEAINLLQYQKAYEAAARFLKVADEMTQSILSLAQ